MTDKNWNTENNRKETRETAIYLPEIMVWFRNFFEVLQSHTRVLGVARSELQELRELKERFLQSTFSRCRCGFSFMEPEGYFDSQDASRLRYLFFHSVRFTVRRIQNHPVMTANLRRQLGLDRPECLYVLNECEKEMKPCLNIQL